MSGYSHPYWLEVPALKGSPDKPQDAEIVIIGSGLSGVSTAYWLQEKGYSNLLLVDYEPEKAATFRNCGHILYGTVESMQALVALHGAEVASKLWSLSIDVCHEVRDTIRRHQIEAHYKQDGYLVIAIDESEEREIQQSIELLQQNGFASEYVTREQLEKKGFRNVFGGRFEPGSAQAHPTLFRNGLLDVCLKRGLKYHSGVRVEAVEEVGDKVRLKTTPWGSIEADAAVIAANAYSPLLSEFFARYRLVEPYRGQIITSKPLQHRFPVRFPHSFDHGYEYAIITEDNRLMIGGWRNRTEGGELGTYEINVNPLVELGLREFVENHYALTEKVEWEFSWSGIMAASKTGFPFIGPTDSQRIFTCSGYTGHGFSWAHGSAKILADIINGDPVPDIVREKCNPRFFI
ncbi:MAG TPA: FAD-dependent oxidoreductase [Oligoflexus sp.]|uniref:NAD(P)/FAD-dependent oxidoreductase n=1 Tax=Oligoflexus sp. TaxID=1971216 RepID=UPI002D730B78|nr:FAD-dependent oxidoreductase [Oligoflexus sp.]HYX34843.1 FAD-dependent oxidoreductase [Oligoflexus sp.]